ncbi:MarR family transcriptional regulator [Paenibacillus lactis]|uniref:LexA DNA-binding domain protein n=1 Tax=Paenibacillus lactis 154 TaxID=743719 RepID=G4HNT3_9BACL|nr:MarR family transcriptional regulator [Paenibacillus lactis]EHB50097.1 LexA DNA-binding domain protein [Paenibacillus lactis 154]
MDNKTLTRRQYEVLEFIKAFISKYGYSPTVREISEHMGYSSASTAFSIVEALVKKGCVRKNRGPRTIHVV